MGVSIVPAFSLDMLSYWEWLFSDLSMDEYLRPCLSAQEPRRRKKGAQSQAGPRNGKGRWESGGGKPQLQEGDRAFCPQIASMSHLILKTTPPKYYYPHFTQEALLRLREGK